METGIEGLDELLDGGIPEKNQTLVAGGPGTGKSLMAFEMAYRSAKKGIPSAYVALDEKPDNILKNVKNTFTSMTDIDELIRRRLLAISGEDSASKVATNTGEETSYSMGNLMSEIEGIIKSVEAEVAVIDSISFLKLMLGKTLLYNKSVSSLISNLRRLDVTGLITLEIPYYNRERMKFGQELLLFDGVMVLYHVGDEHTGEESKEESAMQVVKMRGNSYRKGLSRYKITADGIKFK